MDQPSLGCCFIMEYRRASRASQRVRYATRAGSVAAREDLTKSLKEAGIESGKLMIVETEQTALRDLKALLRLIKEGKLRVSDKTGFPSAASMKLIEGTFSAGDLLFLGYHV